MFNEKLSAEILEKYPCEGRMTAYFLASELNKKLGRLKKRIKHNRLDACDEDALKLGEWLRENFPKADEGIRDKKRVLKRISGLEKSMGKVRFFEVFSVYLKDQSRCDTEHIKELFAFVNTHGEGLDLADGKSLVMLFECAVYDGILDCFAAAFENGVNVKESLERVEDLFFTLDELCSVNDDDVLLFNKTEKMLKKDPCGIYSELSPETKNNYRENLIRLSKKRKEPSFDLAERIVNECSKNEGEKRHIGAYLCDRADGGNTYLVLLAFLTVLFTTLLCIVSPVFLLSVFSVYRCTRLLLDKIFNRFFVKPFHLPRIELCEIPDASGIMVVITTLLTGGDGDKRVFDNLEKMYHSNGGKNVYFGILADLADSETEINEKDGEIISAANKKIMKLRQKYGESFFLFMRNREYSQSEMCYIAPERKRGAVGALTSFLCSKSDAFTDGSIKPNEEICKNVRFVFTLDSDTNLAFDCLKHMAGIMLHPQNMPAFDEKRGVVTKGYGILQPSMSTTLSSAMNTYFSKVMCGHGGVDVYSSGGSDYYMSLFGRSIFCGKGMFDKNCFYKTLCGKNDFKKESILSHDAPEGARLRCAYVPDVTLTDSFPKEELSYYKRGHRWIRGDIQNFPFVLPKVENTRGERIKNGIGVFSKFFLLDNIINAFVPIFSLLSLFASLFCEKSLGVFIVTVTFAVYILPFAYSVVMTAKRTIWHNVRRIFYSRGIYTGIWTSFMRMLFKICSIPKSAAVSFDAVVRSIYRMVFSGRKKLEWMTSAQSDEEKDDGLLGYVKKNLFSAFCGCIFFVTTDIGFMRFISLLWLFLPLFCYRTGLVHGERRFITQEQKKTLIGYAEDMWRFFDENTNEKTNHLPPDNVALYPERKMSRMTSPTNIGLYLLSVVAARKFGFIDSCTMHKRIENCIGTVESLPKYKGLLYNWYDVFTAKCMEPKYISSVDMGNCIVCLECVIGALYEFEDELTNTDGLILRIKRLIDKADLSLLYDKQRQLFYIGAVDKDGKLLYDKNRYDMLMSEARSLSFAAVSKRLVPASHLSYLSRRFVEGEGFMGLASWSGTAFEFFMPELFLKSNEGSLLYEALCFAYSQQKKAGVLTENGRIFGISESCYNELDGDMNYKYKAFGAGRTAVNVFEEKKVFSPYSSFLFLPMSLRENLKNLETFEKIGAYGEYGFYESVDFENTDKGKDYSVVQCFMSHHVGMSICACSNAVFDNVIHDWFMKDIKNRSAVELADEKIPYDAYVKRISRRNYGGFYTQKCEDKKQPLNECRVARLEMENLSVYAKRDRMRMKYFGYLVTGKKSFGNSLGAFGVSVDIDGESFCFGKDCTLSSTGGKIVYLKRIKLYSGDIFDASLSVTIGRNTSDAVRMRLRLKQLSGEKNKHLLCTFSFVPLIESAEKEGECTFFEENARFLNIRDDEVFRFENSNTNVYLYTKIHVGKNTVCSLENDVVTLQAEPVNDMGVYECQFAMMLSKSDKCAEMGMVRLKEESFDETAAALEKAKQNVETKKRGRFSNVLGASVTKKTPVLQLPVNSREEPFMLMSGRRFSSLFLCDNLGFSFGIYANKKRVTQYDIPDKIASEMLTFDDGFDLCKNADNMSFSKGIAVYEGKHREYVYKVEVFIPENDPMKIIRVSTDSILPLCFSVKPEQTGGMKAEIAGGMVLFGLNDDGGETCFLCGYLENCGRGADYSIGDVIKAGFKGHGEDGVYEYVFAVGRTENIDNAYDCEALVRTEYESLKQSAVKLCKSMTIDISLMPKTLRTVISDFYVFPKSNVIYRSLVKTSETLMCFDMLLLCYTKDKTVSEKFLHFLESAEEMSTLSKLVCPVILSEYVRMSGDVSYPDINVLGESIYRLVLVLLSEGVEEGKTNRKMTHLAQISLASMADLCDRIGDIRTASSLRDRLGEQKDENKGVFM